MFKQTVNLSIFHKINCGGDITYPDPGQLVGYPILDLEYFGNIVPCGIIGKDVTSIKRELGKEINMDEVKEKLLGHFTDIMGMEFEMTE